MTKEDKIKIIDLATLRISDGFEDFMCVAIERAFIDLNIARDNLEIFMIFPELKKHKPIHITHLHYAWFIAAKWSAQYKQKRIEILNSVLEEIKNS